MFARFRNFSKDEAGFTLIELLVVILIIGILAAIAIPVFLNQQKKAGDAALKSDVKNLATIYHTYAVDRPNAVFPDYQRDWRNDGDTGLTNTNNGVFNKDFNFSEGTRLHSYDAGVYSGQAPGQWFCIEAASPRSSFSGGNDTTRLIYSSRAGGFVSTCTSTTTIQK